jgi:8-oxo-dGTP pyrophosphatase MutT (NUDIX family)
MEFNNFLQIVPRLISETLKASDSHLKMAPIERVKYYQNYDYSVHNPKSSAVVTLFYPKNEQTKVLLIVRSKYPGVHSSQIAFPGGKWEKEDVSLEQTALRELEEEVGVAQGQVQLVKQWSELYIPPSNFLVTPFLGIATELPQWSIQEEEVAEIIELDLEVLLSEDIVQNVSMTTTYANNIEVPAFVIDGHVVWGATAMILSEVKESIKSVLEML